jgi:hypothetical protein
LGRLVRAIGDRLRRSDRALSVHLHAELRSGLSQPGCLLCRQELDQQEKYYFWFVNEQYYEGGVVRAMQASRGFCLRHTRRLLQTAPPGLVNTVGGYVLAEVLRALRAAGRLGRGAEMARLAGPTGPCPACVAERGSTDRAFGLLRQVVRYEDLQRLALESGGLCLQHFRAYAAAMSWSELEALGRIALEGLRRGDELPPLLGVDRDRRLRAGQRSPLPPTLALPHQGEGDQGGGHRAWSPSLDGLHALIAQGGCPLCPSRHLALRGYLNWLAAEVDEARHRWQDSLFLCRVHWWDFVPAAETAAAKLAGHLAADRRAELDWLLAALEHRPPAHLPRRLLRLPDKHRELRERGQALRFGRRWLQAIRLAAESPANRLAALKAQLLLPHECPACRYLQTITLRQGRLLALALPDAGTWSAYERSVGVCLPDLTVVLSAISDRDQATSLVRTSLTKLEILAWELDEAGRRQSWSVRYEPKGGERTAWLRAAAQLSGAVQTDDPLVGTGYPGWGPRGGR